MKGIKYNLIFEKPDKTTVNSNALDMNELVDSIKNGFKNNYFLDVKVNNQIVYNIINRPLKSNKLFREKLKIEKK